MLTPRTIGNRIAEARKAKSLSQAQLAQRLSISSQAVGKWERGESMPDITTFNRIAEVLGVDLNYFSETTAGAPPGQAAESSDEKQGKKPSWDMSRGNWVDADFSGLKGLHEKFSASNMQRCKFVGSDLSGLRLSKNNVDTCDFSDSELGSSRIHQSYVVNSVFRDCSLKGVELSGSHIKGCDFSGADFTGAVIKSCTLQKSTMEGAVWNGTAFSASQFADITLGGILKDCSFEHCEFSGLTFNRATLTNTFFKSRSLKKIRFIGCRADRITCAFLKNGKADLSEVTVLPE